MEMLLYLVPVFGILGLLFAAYLAARVGRQDAGNDRMKEIAAAISDGAQAFLTAEYKILVIFVAVLFVLIGFGIGNWITAVCFVVGALFSTLAGFCGMKVATKANVRTANAAKEKGMNKALSIAFSGGAVMGMCVAGFGVFGVSIIYILTKNVDIITGFSLGASSIALFARVGGGIYTKAADVGADGFIGQVSVQFRADNGSRDFFFSGLLFCRFRGSFGYILTGVGAALVGLAVVCFRRLGLLLHLHGFLGGLRCGFLRKRCTGQHGAEHYRRRKQRGNALLQFIMCFFHCEILSKQRFFHEKKRLQNADAAVIFRGYLGRAGLLLFQIFALGLQNRPIGRYALVGQRSNRNGQIHGDPYL